MTTAIAAKAKGGRPRKQPGEKVSRATRYRQAKRVQEIEDYGEEIPAARYKPTPEVWAAYNAPVNSNYNPQAHTIGYVVDFCAAADKGKTLAMVCTICHLLANCGYNPTEVWTNFPLYIPGVHIIDNTLMRRKMREMCQLATRHQIFALDEVDSIYPARFWQNKSHTEELLKLWQATKLENWVLFTEHAGSGINKLMRAATQILVTPSYFKSTNSLHLSVIDGVDLNPNVAREVDRVSRFFGLYDRWEPTK